MSNPIHVPAPRIYLPETAADIPETAIYKHADAGNSAETGTYLQEIAADMKAIAGRSPETHISFMAATPY